MKVFQKLLDLYLRFPWKLEAARTHLGDLKPFFPRGRTGELVLGKGILTLILLNNLYNLPKS